ncbi:hypothetical protein R1flu_015335 [Riccia fluitans]|uniref:Uncharacterized protein n=1 Tax=Riccia fluitans TaxID=41844 RepID=A0ABD1YIN9_9MARC
MRFGSVWRNQILDRAALLNIITTSLVLSLFIVFAMYLTLDSGNTREREFERQSSRDLGRFGNRMVKMVAEDLPFTIFVPSEEAVDKLVRSCARSVNGNLGETTSLNKTEDTEASLSRCVSAVVSRVMSFSTVPKQVVTRDLVEEREMELESLSGYKLYLALDPRRGFVVNNLTLVDFYGDARDPRSLDASLRGFMLAPGKVSRKCGMNVSRLAADHPHSSKVSNSGL